MAKIGEVISLLVASILQMIDNVLRAIFGSKAPSLARALSKVTADDIMNGYRDAAREDVAVNKRAASNIGMAVHRYAAAPTLAERALVDLSSLSDSQRLWLLTMPDEHLERLGSLGAYACEKAALGKKCGVVGLPVPTPVARQHTVKEKRDDTTLVYAPAFSMCLRSVP